MRLLSRLPVIVLVFCLAALALAAAPAQADNNDNGEPDPSIDVSPGWGVPGTRVTVYGYHFTPNAWVDVYYYLDTIDRIPVAEVITNSAGSFTATFDVPESPKGQHLVEAEDEEGENASRYFTVRPGLFVSPASGPVGTNVTVEGLGFDKDEAGIEVLYYITTTTYQAVAEGIEADARGSWETRFLIPTSARGTHDISARGDESSVASGDRATFRVTPEISIEKPSGSVGESITVTGSGFYSGERGITILFDGEAVTTEEVRADDRGHWEEPFVVPAMPAGEYEVTAEGAWTRKEDVGTLDFEIKPGLVLSPDEGHVGMDLTVTGHGFAIEEDVTIMYEGSEVATAMTDDQGSFETSFIVPESRHGERLVTAGDAEGNNGTAIFTMESDPPPTPELVSPPDGDRVGFVGRIRPKFEWTEVEDPSGVYYSLQISASANVTGTGEFVDPIITKEGLVGTNSTLDRAEGLPYGTYYWIVRAVDGAGNAGNWTTANSFRAGRLPMWAFIVIIIGIVGLAGAAVYFFVVRSRMYD